MAEGDRIALAARDLPALLHRVHDALDAHREILDALNVFPVPDGDTGTNMTLTVRAALDALTAVDPTAPDQVAAAVIRGAVRGARGNSGVILSQVVRAVVEVLADEGGVDAATYAAALERARLLAYEAVAEPVEGTILSAISAAALAAARSAGEGSDLVATSTAVCAATAAAVERTPDQLPVLRDAGVVDAGARGFEVVVGAVHGLLTGENPPVVRDAPPRPQALACDRPDDDGYRYEVQYLLDAPDDAAEPLRRRLEVLGGSVVVVAAGNLLNVHVHTDDVGGAIEVGVAVGRPSDIEVVDLRDQVTARADAAERRRVGVVAVLAGDGLTAMARQAGAVPISGAAGSLPSVADLLNACGDVVADEIVLLPGHQNAVATARQAVDVSLAEGGRDLTVIDSAVSPPAVLAALAVCDGQGDPDEVIDAMAAAAAHVQACEVVLAVRDADSPVGAIRQGQPMVVLAGKVVAVCDDPVDAVGEALKHLDVAGAELVSLLVGADVPASEAEAVASMVRESTTAEVHVIAGGQRPSRYWIGVE